MEDRDGLSQPPKALSPHDLTIDPGDPSTAERRVSVAAKVLLAGSGGGLLVSAFIGMAIRGWPLNAALIAALPFCLPFLMLGFLLLQVATSMGQKRDDDSRKVAWEEYQVDQAELQRQRAEAEAVQETGDSEPVTEVAPPSAEERD